VRLRSGIANPLDSRQRIHAVLFDLDGTLYGQRRMRALMALELLMLGCAHPFRAPRTWRALAAYRQAQDIVRSRGIDGPSAQLEIAANRSGLKATEIAEIVGEWMFERPLKYLPGCRAAGLLPLIAFLESKQLELGVLSDHPAQGKLRALGLAGRFSPVLCSTDPEIGVLKPDPRGFLTVSDRWQIDPGEVLVVGDRLEVDAAGATAAGMPCVIVGRASQSAPRSNVLIVPSLERLRYVLSNCC
jgi:FMN phosphatase YigB (HAD superfamily)